MGEAAVGGGERGQNGPGLWPQNPGGEEGSMGGEEGSMGGEEGSMGGEVGLEVRSQGVGVAGSGNSGVQRGAAGSRRGGLCSGSPGGPPPGEDWRREERGKQIKSESQRNRHRFKGGISDSGPKHKRSSDLSS